MPAGLTALSRGMSTLRATHGERYSVGGRSCSAVRQERETKDAMGNQVWETVLQIARQELPSVPQEGAVVIGPSGESLRVIGVRPGPTSAYLHLVVTEVPR